MKTLLIITLIILGTLPMKGQINPMDQLFKDKPRDLILYLNPTFQYSQIALQRTKLAGLGGGVIINKKISLGLVYNTTLGNIALPDAKGSGNLKIMLGGLHFEYTIWPLQVIHLTFPLSTGVGQMKITGNTGVAGTGSPNFFFADPGFMIEANIWKYAKLGIGTSFRYTTSVNYYSLTSGDLNGFAAIISLKFGMFRYSINH